MMKFADQGIDLMRPIRHQSNKSSYGRFWHGRDLPAAPTNGRLIEVKRTQRGRSSAIDRSVCLAYRELVQ
jgi:hypothetical protein